MKLHPKLPAETRRALETADNLLHRAIEYKERGDKDAAIVVLAEAHLLLVKEALQIREFALD